MCYDWCFCFIELWNLKLSSCKLQSQKISYIKVKAVGCWLLTVSLLSNVWTAQAQAKSIHHISSHSLSLSVTDSHKFATCHLPCDFAMNSLMMNKSFRCGDESKPSRESPASHSHSHKKRKNWHAMGVWTFLVTLNDCNPTFKLSQGRWQVTPSFFPYAHWVTDAWPTAVAVASKIN